MANEIDKIIEYLRLSRQTEEHSANYNNTDVNLSILDGENPSQHFTETQQLFEDFSKYKRLVNLFGSLSITHVYLSIQGNNIIYYIRKTLTNSSGTQTFQYRNILENNWSVQNDANFIEKPIDLEYRSYFYSTTLNRIVIKSESIGEVLVTGNTLMYDPEDINYISNGNYEFDYTDHGGNRNTFFANIMKSILGTNNESRELIFNKEEEKRHIHLIPTINEDNSSMFNEYPFIVVYPYTGKKDNPSGLEKPCLTFSFKSITSFLEFLNQTIMTDSGYDFNDESNTRKKNFKETYQKIISRYFEKKLKNTIGELSYRDALMLLYYLPEKVILTLEKSDLWLLLNKTLTYDTVNNRYNLNEEDLVIKLLKCIDAKETNKTLLLNKLLSEKSREKSYFKILYDNIHGDNFITFTKIIQDIWKKSAFILPTKEQYPDQDNYGPMFLPYESEKFLGLYFSNANVSFSKDNQNIKVNFTSKEKVSVKRPNPKGGGYYTSLENKVEHYVYHPFYPIYIENADGQETEIKFDMIVPVFLLKANEDKEFWHNAIKTGEYTLDVATTLSGFGNLAKFRYLAKVAARAETLSFVNKTGRAVAAARKTVAATAAVIEISSGSIGVLLKLTGLEDTVFGKSLYEYLFWLELVSLSGELTVALHNGLSKAAKEIVGNAEKRAKFEKELDNLVESGNVTRKDADSLLEHLDEVAELDLMGKPAKKDPISGGKILSASQRRKYSGELRQNGIEPFFEEDIMLNKAGKKIQNKSALKKFKPFKIRNDEFNTVEEFYFYMRVKGYAGAFHAETKQLFLTENPTEHLAFHERMHVKHYLEVGNEYDSLKSWQRETYVFLEIWNKRHLWTKQELEHALHYVNQVRKDAGQKELNYKI